MVMRFTIFRRLAAIFLFVLALLVVFSVEYTFRMVKKHKAEISEANRKVARDIASQLDAILDKSFTAIDVLSFHPAVNALVSAECDALFARLLPAFPEIANIVLADMVGRNRGSALAPPGVRALTHFDMEWFRRSAAGERVVNNLHISKIIQAPTVMIAAPVRDAAGIQVGVLGMPLDLTTVSRAILAHWNLPPASVVQVLDAEGTILIDTIHPLLVGMKIGSTPGAHPVGNGGSTEDERQDGDGKTRLYGSARPTLAPWEVRVGTPADLAYRDARQIGVQRFLSALLICAVALVPALFFTSRNRRNLKRIQDGVKEVEGGNLGVQVDLDGSDEFTDLALSFNRMVRERREGEEKLRESKTLLTSILDGIGAGVLVIDRDYRIIAANRCIGEQEGQFAKELVGRHCYEATHHHDRPCWENGEDCAVRFTFRTGESRSVRHVHLDRNNKSVHVELKSYPLRDASGNLVSIIEVVNDVTERVRLEQQLRHSQKLEAVGQLAGGVAHDFNNVLTAISGFASLITVTLPRDDPHYPYLQQILAAVKRASALTRSLLAFSRKQILIPEPVAVGAILGNIEKLLARIIGANIELRICLPADELTIMADTGQIEQVLMNLAANARDAMPNGGLLTIETDALSIDQEFIRAHGFGRPGVYIRISVSDSGVGMDEKTLESIFEPFFTTKEAGKGTGLGLSIAFGIIEQHSGYIVARSEPGKGTTFTIYLPRLVGATVPAAVTGDDGAVAPTPGKETVLVVEDDEAVLDFLTTALESFGYIVITARDGEAAIAKFIEHRDRIHLLLLDMVLPKKGGREVCDEIQRTYPGLKVIFMSGDPSHAGQDQDTLVPGVNFLLKPISTHILLKMVREILG